MLALSIRQPFAELILRGVKTVEYRSRATRIIGERFWIYASRSELPVVSCQLSVKSADNIAVPGEPLPAWMIEWAEQVGMIEPGTLLPKGVIVGSAVIAECKVHRHGGTQAGREEGIGISSSSLRASVPSCLYEWHLADVRRAKRLRKPDRHPQPVWFRPF